MQLWIGEDIYKSDKLSVYGLAAYCAIKTLLPNDEIKEICVTCEILAYQLTKSIDCSRRFYSGLKTGYDELIEQGIIKVVNSKGKYDVIDCDNLFISSETDFFTIITYDELLRIFQIKEVNVLFLLRYFIFLIGTINSSIDIYIDPVHHKSRVVGNLTIEYISKLSGISERSIIDYNKILEKFGLIYIYRQKDFLISKNTGEISRLPNVYGRPEDKMYIDTFATTQKEYNNSYKYVENNINRANSKRRLAQIYNQIRIGNDSKYSIEDIQQVYSYVLQENNKYQELYDKTKDIRYLEKVRDIQVFDKYDFIQKEETD